MLTKALIGKYKDWLRGVGESAGCLICGNTVRIDPAHIRHTARHAGKVNPGIGAKPEPWILPLCRDCHELQHKEGNEPAFWAQRGIRHLSVSAWLWIAFCRGDHEAGCHIIEDARR